MKSFFTNIGPKLAEKSNRKWEYFGEISDNDIPDFYTDIDEVINFSKEIDPIKSSGMDELSSKICMDAFLALPDKLMNISTERWSRAFFQTSGRQLK